MGLGTDVIGAVQEITPELHVTRGHDRREVGHRSSRGEDALRTVGEVEEVAQPAGDVLLQLHHRRARTPQTRVPIDPLGDEFSERSGEEPAPGDVGKVARPRVLERSRHRLLHLGEQIVEGPPVLGWATSESAGQVERALGCLRRCVIQPADEVDEVVEGRLTHLAHLGG